MKKNRTNLLLSMALAFLGVFVVLSFNSCDKEEDPVEDPIATFQYEISEENYLQVVFSNFSSNAETYLWAFGDGNTSTDENPVHTYAEPGVYEVTLTATNSADVSASYNASIEIQDPFEALARLAGETSKTWKLYRVESSMGVGPNMETPRDWWALFNDGTRPCVYYHEFTFHRDGTYEFNDNGSFWGEGGLFPEDLEGTCFPAEAANMFNVDGDDVSAWLGGTHQFEFDAAVNQVTLLGEGAWIGLPKTGTDGEVTVPQTSVTFNMSIEEREGYDYMHVWYDYGDLVWSFSYAHYHDPSLEPPVEEEAQEWGEDLPDITPDEIFVTFAARDAENMATIDTVTSGSTVAFGVEDPLGGDQNVGEFTRTEGVQYQELQFRTTPELNDIQFDNFTTAKIDIYIPADTDFSVLQRTFVFGFADVSATQEWWNSPVQFLKEGEDVVLGEWTTYEFDLTDVKARNDLDMIYLGMGGGGHEAGGTFYVRNLIFE
ncbi:MAG: PKD domain-containing protein [Bacteroidota bacterium]